MYIIDKKLQEREANNRPIRVGIVGTGEMGKGLVNQICRYTPGMRVDAIYSRTIEKAENTLKVAGEEKYIVTENPAELAKAMNDHIPVITTNIDLLIENEELDILVEVTGHIQFGLDWILKAFAKGKNVLSFNAELEATFGPLLKTKAAEHGVLYSLGDGDQPGVTMNLYRQVRMMGFEPLVCGNIKGLQDHYRNPSTQENFAKQWGMKPEMATNFADGTKISFEQASIANATNMQVAKRGMLGPEYKGHVDEITDQFLDVDALRQLGGIVDYVVGAKPGPGVFVYAASEDPLSIKYLKYGKLGDGPLYSFYVPYHLLFFELAFSIARLIDFQDVTLDAEYGMKVEVVATAKVDLHPGDEIDGLGGYKTYGICENSDISRKENLVPMGLAEGMKMKNFVAKDQQVTLDDVSVEGNADLIKLYLDQTAVFA